MAASDTLENVILQSVLNNAAWPGYGDVYLALHTANPTDDQATAADNEVTDGDYVRQDCDPAGTGGFTVSNGTATNAQTITFPAIADAQVTVTHWSIWSDDNDPSAGTMLIHNALQASKTLDVSDVPSFPAGSLSISVS